MLQKAREEAEGAARVSGCRLTFLGTPRAQQQQQQHCHCHSALHCTPLTPLPSIHDPPLQVLVRRCPPSIVTSRPLYYRRYLHPMGTRLCGR